MIAAALLLHPLIMFLVAVVVALVLLYVISLFIPDPKLLIVIRLLVGLILLVYALNLFGIIA